MATGEPRISPGDLATRAEIRTIFGGSAQSGICPSPRTKSVLLFSDERLGLDYGWAPSSAEPVASVTRVFQFMGAGMTGDQTFDGIAGRLNAAVLLHAERGWTLRLFVNSRKAVSEPNTYRYLGSFTLDTEHPYDVHASRDSTYNFRRVIYFRLVPTVEVRFDPIDGLRAADKTTVDLVPTTVAIAKIVEPERRRTVVNEASLTAARVRRYEAELSDRLEEQLIAMGHEVKRVQITIRGKTSYLVTDLYDVTAHVLYELKSNCSREAVRMALGQLFDYARFVTFDNRPARPRLSIALPASPDVDLLGLLAEHRVALVHCGDGAFMNMPE